MKTITVEQFKSFRPCWLETAKGREKFARIAAIRTEWTALDVLNLPDVSAEDKFWSVLREEFIDAPILHEFACRCAEYALSFVESPDPRSIAAIEAKRKWLRGEITDAELDAARAATWYAARVAASRAARDAARAAAMAAAQDAARDAAMAAASDAASDAALEHEVEILMELLVEGGKPMTREEAARILDPKTTEEAYNDITYGYASKYWFSKWYNAKSEACKMGAEAIRELDAKEEQKQKPLTINELRQMDDPVWCLCEPIEGGNGFWCLCKNGKIITPAGTCFYVSEIPNWIFLRCKPKEEHHAE